MKPLSDNHSNEKENLFFRLKNLGAKRRGRNHEVAVVTYGFLFLFMAMALYFVWFVAFESESFINSPYNARVKQFSKHVIRGDIVSSDGKVLATSSVDEAGNETRRYPYANEYAHVVGYVTNGMAGAELEANFNLLRSHSFFVEKIINDVNEKKNQGDAAVLTIDSSLQDVAYAGLGTYKGAVVAIEPSTGKILCLVSKPDYDPNTIAANWDIITGDESSTVLLNRATQGLYPPGSTFKIVTALEYLSEGGRMSDTFDCEGTYTYDDVTFHCYKNSVHGHQDFKETIGNSCNCAFAEIGLELNVDRMGDLCEQLLFNKNLPTTLNNAKKSSFVLEKGDSTSLLMQTAFGQGETLMTPMHGAMLAAAIANDGELMRAYDIDRTLNSGGDKVQKFAPRSAGNIMSKAQADTLKTLMRYVITDGTGTAMDVDTYTAYGKTGTAEFNEAKDAHSWFIGYAENDGRQMAIAVVMEGAGSGNGYALPLAKQVFDTYFK